MLLQADKNVGLQLLECLKVESDPAGLLVEKKELSPVQDKNEGETLVPVQIAFRETALKEMAKKMRGRWDPEVRLWYIPFRGINGTDLEKYIILDASMKNKTSESI